jgi:hypothetical protein
MLPFAMHLNRLFNENAREHGTTHSEVDMSEFRKIIKHTDDIAETVMLSILKQLLEEKLVVMSFGFPYSNENKDVENDSVLYVDYKKRVTAASREQ